MFTAITTGISAILAITTAIFAIAAIFPTYQTFIAFLALPATAPLEPIAILAISANILLFTAISLSRIASFFPQLFTFRTLIAGASIQDLTISIFFTASTAFAVIT